MLPIVLVAVTKSFSSVAFKGEFTSSECGLFLEASSKFWAKQGYLSREDTKKITNSRVFHHLKQVKRNLEKIIEENKGQEGNKKTKSCAEESILSIKQLERDLEDDSEKESKQTAMYTEEGAQFIENT
ncbi:hypothetical protein BCV72DRAFT_244214 [Rhizopus microsporus var. microsporus]|uniref:Uncharacterized protein n=2 Tax=Rhizopus microsporus TaxID=58291 RepID=A0A2G4SJW6_RHIZD|nr:uncharacterized protein RHIMIDRAFT_246356 [Rhizopus microsporus ATCC 52813]ORE03690.1 hypothetical protein BCV72DRAFT_244214 [Rhizopus microsporus var. microsporus]PHZ09042.1 hypothetical protein RHIMIDRAFT_246356 [Rhizopus microsporus ATCC 52813]